MPGHDADPRGPRERSFYLPDFCSGPAVLAVVLIVELVALILTIARQPIHSSFWIDLASTSLFLLWLGLGCAAALCRSRSWLMTLPVTRAYAIALALMVGVVVLVSEVVFQLGQRFSGGLDVMSAVFPRDHAGFLLRNLAIGFIVSALALRYFYVSAEWKRSIELEARARIHALQARIRPHFLFNSMNTIAALTRSNPERAEEAVEDLADLFRATLADARQRIPLEEEMEVARVYQRMEHLRLGERLSVHWDVASLPMDAPVPGLMLQPLLENAIYHGIEKLPQGGVITISGRLQDGTIRIEVTNPLPAPGSGTVHSGNRLALDNIRQRLDLAWPGRSNVTVNRSDTEYRVTLSFPYSFTPEA